MLLGSMIQEGATTIKTAYGSEVTTDADLNTLSPASVDELKKLTKYSMVFASQSSDYACLDAVNYQTRTSFSKRQVFLVHLQKENKSNRY